MKLKHDFSGLVYALVILMLTFAIPSEAAAPGPSANGHGTLLVLDEDGNTVRRQFSFSARTAADGTVSGTAVLHNPAFSGANGNKYQAKMDITCMNVIGNIAIFGGTIQRTNDPNLVDTAFFSVQDNGEPGRNNDRISSLFFFDDDPNNNPGDPQGCLLLTPADLPLNVIDGGNIQVRP